MINIAQFDQVFSDVQTYIDDNLRLLHDTNLDNMAWNISAVHDINHWNSLSEKTKISLSCGKPSDDNRVIYGTLWIEPRDKIPDPYALASILYDTGCIIYNTRTAKTAPWLSPGEITMRGSGRIVQCEIHAPVNLFPELKKEIDETVVCAKLSDELVNLNSHVLYSNPKNWTPCTIGT